MEKNKRWAVALDDTEMDHSLLAYLAGLSEVFNPEKVYLITILREKKSYAYESEEYYDFIDQVEQDVRQNIQDKAEKYFGKGKVPYEIIVEYGTPLEEIIQLVVTRTISLVVAGRKRQSQGSGVVSGRLSRNLPCEFLLVPEKREFTVDNILLPTDFSDHSQLALTRALAFKQANKKTRIYAFHGYQVPMGYSKSGKSYEEFADIMKSHAKKGMTRWLQNETTHVTPVLSLIEDSLEELILALSAEKAIDLIVIGSKGQSVASLALLGSNTMKILEKNLNIPLLIVKKPGENIGFIQAVRQL